MTARNRKGNPSYAPPGPNDFFQTPSWATRAILHQLPKRCRYLDVGCGSGAIGSVVAAEGVPAGLVYGFEINQELADKASLAGLTVEVGDFLQAPIKEWEDIQVIISNPPYSQALEFLKKSLEIVKPNMGTVAMILRLPFLATQARAQFHRENPSDIYILPRRPSFTGKGTDATDYGWFVWGPGRGNHWGILDVPTDETDPREATEENRILKDLQDAEDEAEFGKEEEGEDAGSGDEQGEADG